jgi:hypothetical protein
MHAQDLRQIRRDRTPAGARLSAPREVHRAVADRGDALEAFYSRRYAGVFGRRDRSGPEPGSSSRQEGEEAIGLGKRQGLQEDGIEHAEDGGIGPDPEREREHCHGGKARAPRESADGVADVVGQRGHGLLLTRF